MHHPVFGMIFLPHSVNLVHHLSPQSHHPSLPLSSIPDLKLTCSTNLSHHRSTPIPTGLPTGFQPDCLHGLCTTQRYVLALPLSSFSWRVCRTKLAFSYFYHTLIKTSFIRSFIHSFIHSRPRTRTANKAKATHTHTHTHKPRSQIPFLRRRPRLSSLTILTIEHYCQQWYNAVSSSVYVEYRSIYGNDFDVFIVNIVRSKSGKQ